MQDTLLIIPTVVHIIHYNGNGDISDLQVERYARHILLPELGGAGQAKIMKSKVLVVGAGGLGSPVVLYLAAAGVGTIGIIDDDDVDLSNLQRQIAHTTARIGLPKVESACNSVREINPDVTVQMHKERLTEENAIDFFFNYNKTLKKNKVKITTTQSGAIALISNMRN